MKPGNLVKETPSKASGPGQRQPAPFQSEAVLVMTHWRRLDGHQDPRSHFGAGLSGLPFRRGR